MTEYPIFVFSALLILIYGLFSRVADKSIVTAPMAFITVGILCSYFSWNIFTEGVNAPLVRILAELTLILVLFNDASTINRVELKKERSLPTRSLLIGLPLTMIFGVILAIPLFPDVPVPGESHLSSIC